MRKTAIALVVVIILSALAVPALAQDDEVRLDLDFKSESLNQVLQMFRRGYGLEYTLGEGVNPEMQITTHLRGVTLNQALRSIMEPNGLIAVEQDGRYIIRQRPQPQEREEVSRVVSPAYAPEGRTPPPPTRTVRDYEPRRAAAADNGDGQEERDTVMEIIWPVHLGADMASSIFGGGFIEAGGFYGGGTGGVGTQRGGTTGGYGTQRGGTSGYGSQRGSTGFGSQRGGIGGTQQGGFGSQRGGIGGSTNRNFR